MFSRVADEDDASWSVTILRPPRAVHLLEQSKAMKGRLSME